MKKILFFILLCTMHVTWSMEIPSAEKDSYYLTVLDDKPLIKSKKAAIIVDAYEKKPEAIKWLKQFNSCVLYSFIVPRRCWTSSHTYYDEYTLSPFHMLENGFTKDKTPMRNDFNFPTRVPQYENMYHLLTYVCRNDPFNRGEREDKVQTLITKAPVDKEVFAGYICLMCTIIAENKNIKLFKTLLNQEEFATAVYENSFRILQNICASDIDTPTFKALIETYCFVPWQKMTCTRGDCHQKGINDLIQKCHNKELQSELQKTLRQYEIDYCKAFKNNTLKNKQAEGRKFKEIEVQQQIRMIDLTAKKIESDDKSFLYRQRIICWLFLIGVGIYFIHYFTTSALYGIN
jgi:hypothetical protein